MKTEDPDWDDLIVKKLTGSLSVDEETRFDKQLTNDVGVQARFDQAKKLWEESGRLHLRNGLPREARWNRLQEKMALDNPAKLSRTYRLVLSYATAAMVLFLLLFIFYTRTSVVEITTLQGEMKSVTLPDQSVVTLNAETTIRYDPSSWDEERTIALTGEAFFNVKKNGLPFKVTSTNAVINVLGTTFNIRSRKEITAVVCSTGKVSVGSKSDTNKTVILQSGYATAVEGSTLQPAYAVSSEEEMNWLSGGLHFKNAPLKDVFAELERHFNKSIRIPNDLGLQTFTGKFKHPQFQEVLKTVCLSAGLKYSITADSTAIVE
jgi:transmembrane sensor